MQNRSPSRRGLKQMRCETKSVPISVMEPVPIEKGTEIGTIPKPC
jgi:hypothetical protein